jgi:UDP-N-acetyl-D-mannosaminuronic acid transferase (WecB/TagA/CpsF family)
MATMRPSALPISRPVHSDVFARVEPKGEWSGPLRPDGFRSLFGVKVCDMGWTEALTYVELLSNLRHSPRTLSFVDRQTALRLSVDADCRAVLGDRILLPSSRTLAWMARWQGGEPLKTNFHVAGFVDALLTFVPRCHVALVGARSDRLEAMRQHLSQHAPWHMFSIVRAADIGGGIVENSSVAGFVGAAPDMVIVDANGYEEEARFEKAVGLRHNGLILMAGAAFNGRNS